MKRLLSTARALLFLALSLILVLAVVWPWPAPAIDWQTPVEEALRKHDCKTVVTYLDAAVRAGVIEAVDARSKIAAETTCYNDQAPLPDPATRKYILSGYREGGDYAGSLSIYHVDSPALDPWTATYAYAALRACALPYNGLHQIDNVQLSEIIPSEPTLVYTFHRWRRQVCVRILDRTARWLMRSGNRAARDIALSILREPPSSDDPESAVALAQLVLIEGFVSSDDRPHIPDRDLARQTAWSHLELAARAGNVDAMRMMARLLHDGRFRAADDKKAFYWILRLRRFGHSAGQLDSLIERSLNERERAAVSDKEAYDSSRLVTSTP